MSLIQPDSSDLAINFTPRSYQWKIFQVARARNTIAVLPTGSGKTMIAVMLIQQLHLTINLDKKLLIIFLAPRVSLVNQQYQVIKNHTDDHLKVKQYYGALGVDDWDSHRWNDQVQQQHVMVMTPQILLDALRKAFLNLNLISLIVFDECHNATGNHPYSKIMKEFYHKSMKKPKIFGMTASPIVRKGISSCVACDDQLSTLESLLDSKIYAIEDRTELPSTNEVRRYYDPNLFLHVGLKKKLESSWLKFDKFLLDKQSTLPNQYKDNDETFMALRKKLRSYHAKIVHCLEGLGFLCAHEAAKICLDNARVSVSLVRCELYRTGFVQCRHFLEEALYIFEESSPNGYDKDFITEVDCLKATKMGYISTKLYELIQIIELFGRSKELLCLIFVERIITAKVIQRFMNKVSYLSHLTGSYLTGGSASVDALTPTMQKKTLDSFRSGEVNLLFTTDVAEEGIHVANCSCVIRFDLPKTVRSYVQSRGRARQDGSHYIIMLERENIEQRNMLLDIIRSEHSMTASTLARDLDSCLSKPCLVEELKTYHVESTGASVTSDSSVNLIYRFCEKLPRDMYFTPKPRFDYTLFGELYECELTLPPSALLQKVVGPKSRNTHLAKQLVCLEACQKLHELGALDDHLLPSSEESIEDEKLTSNKDYSFGAGTTKRKELHGTTVARALSGSWGCRDDDISLYAYKIDFSCNQVDEFFSPFVLLMEARLDNDVAKAEVELFLIGNKFVKSSISPYGKLQLNTEQVKNARLFQEFFFNGLFGKLYIGSKFSGIKREFLLNDENESLWRQSNMYMLLPLEPLSSNGNFLAVDWRCINSCASSVEFVKQKFSMVDENFSSKNHDEAKCKSSDTIYLANTSVLIHDLTDMVVFAIHTGKIYSVLEVRIDMSAESSFEGEFDMVPSNCRSFREYFQDKYEMMLHCPGQPLLRLKQSHNPHNLLSKIKNEVDAAAEKTLAFVHMPPELLVSIDVPLDVVKSFYLLPSLMHRLESLMLAVQLREEISCGLNSCYISSFLILEALTSLRCCEDFSLERLELLGDSVLKYVVSGSLYLKYPEKHEGQLSARRSYAVCNSTLHKLGINRKLQGYIRDGAFDPRRWVAPGQRTLRPVSCECGVDTYDVPAENKFVTDDPNTVVGKACDRGHRWMCSKTIADCVEALIGAYYVGGGLTSATTLMKWLGVVDVDLGSPLIDKAIANANANTDFSSKLERLEKKLKYSFMIKGLLMEAVTHASQQELGVGYCYQRLEFLGDSVLDLLITRYLFENHKDIDPGELTDLRSASVNNESFAKIAVRHDLQQHLGHCSGLLSEQIAEFAESVLNNNQPSFQMVKCPKALGDLVESIAGAILIDTKLNLDEVWRIFRALLCPIVTPEKLELPPYRELNELCSHLGYFIQETCARMEEDETVVVELGVQLEDILLKGVGCDKRKKTAKGQAALQLLKDLESRGISHSRHVYRNNSEIEVFSSADVDVDICRQRSTALSSSEMSKLRDDPASAQDSKDVTAPEPVVVIIDEKKGGPRSCLFELCKRMQWPMPSFSSTERQSRYAVQVGDRMAFNIFVSKIKLHIPKYGVVEQTGKDMADKKTSHDSAALEMLHWLGAHGKCIIASKPI